MMSWFKSAKRINQTLPKKRLVGPGTTALLIVLVYICGTQYFSKPKVTIERQVEASVGVRLARKPSILQLLSRSDELHLTASQKKVMERLAQEQKNGLAPVEASIREAMKEFTEFADSHSSEAVGLNAVQAKAGSISQLSRQKRQLEQGFAEQAFAVLAPSQKEMAARLNQAKAVRKLESKMEAASQ